MIMKLITCIKYKTNGRWGSKLKCRKTIFCLMWVLGRDMKLETFFFYSVWLQFICFFLRYQRFKASSCKIFKQSIYCLVLVTHWALSVSQYAARRTVGFKANVHFINEGFTKRWINALVNKWLVYT